MSRLYNIGAFTSNLWFLCPERLIFWKWMFSSFAYLVLNLSTINVNPLFSEFFPQPLMWISHYDDPFFFFKYYLFLQSDKFWFVPYLYSRIGDYFWGKRGMHMHNTYIELKKSKSRSKFSYQFILLKRRKKYFWGLTHLGTMGRNVEILKSHNIPSAKWSPIKLFGYIACLWAYSMCFDSRVRSLRFIGLHLTLGLNMLISISQFFLQILIIFFLKKVKL